MKRQSTPSDRSTRYRDSNDTEFVSLVDRLTCDLVAGNSIDMEALCCEHPQYSKQLLALLPAIQTMADLSVTVAPTALAQINMATEKIVGDYRILREIGRGGMGVVYEAEQISLGRRVALKVLPFTGLLDERQLERFRKEARAAASLRHPNIVSVHEVGTDGVIHYYAMDLIEGTDLASAIQSIHQDSKSTLDNSNSRRDTKTIAALSTQRGERRRDFFRSVARLGVQAADAVQYAHAEGIVHRDIKPANLLLDNDGVIHIADFGLAHVQTEEELTLTGDLIGTLRYMSPEQIEGSKFADPRSDVYSLGLSLYELIAGEPAIVGGSRAELLRTIADGTPRRLRSLVSDLPTDLETIIEKAIANSPDDRYQSAAELHSDLQAFLDIREIKARPSTQLDRLKRFAKRNPTLAITFATVLVLVSLLAGVSTLLAYTFFQQAASESARLDEKQQLLAESKKRERLQRLGLYCGDMRTAQVFARERSYFELQDTLLKWVPEKGEEDFRSFEWNHLWTQVDNPALLHAFNHELPTSRVCFLGNNEIVSTSFSDRAKRLSLAPGKLATPVAYYPSPNTNIAGLFFDRVRDRVFIGDGGGAISVYSTESNELIRRLQLKSDQAKDDSSMLHVSPNGKWLAISSGHGEVGQVAVMEIESGNVLLELELPADGRAGFGRGNELVVASYRHDSLRIYSPGSWEERRTIDLEADGVVGFAFSEDRSLLAVALTSGDMEGFGSSRIEVWHVSDWQRVATFATNYPAKGVAFRHDNQQLAWADYGGQVSFATLGGSPRQTFRRKLQTGAIYSVAYSPDGTRIVTAGSNALAGVWDVEALTTYNFGRIRRPGIAASGIGWINEDQFAIGQWGVGVTVIEAATGKGIAEIAHPSRHGSNHSLRCSPDTGQVLLGEVQWPVPSETSTSEVVVWDADRTRTWRTELPALGTSVTSFTVTPDGRYFAACTHHEGVIIVDLKQKKIVKRFPDIYCKTIHCSADSHTLALGVHVPEKEAKQGQSRGIAYIIDLSNFEIQETIEMDRRLIDCVAISADGNLVAAVGFDFQLQIYDREKKTLRSAKRSIPGFPNCVRFSPDSKRLLTASLDGQLIMWVTETGEQIQSWDIRPFDWTTFEFSKRGDILAVGGLNELHIFHAPLSDATRELSATQLRTQACQNVSRIEW